MSSPRLMFERASASAAYSIAGAGVLCVMAMMVMITSDVIARYVFNRPTMWADEMATYLMIAIVFLGLAQNLRQGDHIRIDVVTNLVPSHARLFLEVIAYAVGIVFSAMLAVACWFRFDNFWVHKTTSDSPVMTELWIPMVPVLLGAAVFCLVMVAGFMTSFHALLNRYSGRASEI